MTPHACPPVNDCQPDPHGTLAKSHAFAEGAARCDCGKLLNVDNHAAIVTASRALVAHLQTCHVCDMTVVYAQTLADLLPSVAEERS